jgi:hypothetical protein
MVIKQLILKKSGKIVFKGILCVFIALFLTIPSGAVFIRFNSIFSRNSSNSSVYAMGAVIIVAQDGTGDYLSIQDAINHALPGDHIIVNAGTYRDQLTINVARLNITAAIGESPTIDVSSYAVGIEVTAVHVLLDGFTIIGNGSRVGGPYPTIRASTGADGLVVNSSSFRVTIGYGWMVLMSLLYMFCWMVLSLLEMVLALVGPIQPSVPVPVLMV